MRDLVAYYQKDLAKTVAFGDNFNDVAMLKRVQTGYVMGSSFGGQGAI